MKTIDKKAKKFMKIEFTIHLLFKNYYRNDFQIENKKETHEQYIQKLQYGI